MTIRNLEKLFKPRSIALFGASEREGSVGTTVTANLFDGGFDGEVWLVNPKRREVAGQKCYSGADELPGVPDLAVIATPPQTVPEIIQQVGDMGTKAAVVITAGFRQAGLTDDLLKAAEPYCLRIVGPNCFGVMMPGIGLNASFAHTSPLPGDLALISQSGALVSAVLGWSKERGIGFSSMISMGNMADVDVGDLLDYLAADNATRAILMYIEQITDARKFMSAARSAARVKPVVVIKSGRHEAAAKAAQSHTGAMAGSDAVYNAAFHRAGVLRVKDLEDLFDAAETISRLNSVAGGRMGIVTNGGGAGVMAVDELLDCGGELASLTDATIERLNEALPETWSRSNPVDIIGDAGADRYEAAMRAVLEDANTDAVLVINCPTALASSDEAAQAVVKAVDAYNKTDKKSKPVLTCWFGGGAAEAARKRFTNVGYPTFETPADAVQGFSFLMRHARDQKTLMQTPPALPEDFTTDLAAARKVIDAALAEGRELLTEVEAKDVLKAFHIPTVRTVSAKTPDNAAKVAREFIDEGSQEVAVKILSKDITHKSDVGGVALGLPGGEAVKRAAQDMLDRLAKSHPDARIEGFAVQPMIRRQYARELILGISEDSTFGPVVMFGAGGTAVEVIRDTAMALPPLDMKLALDLMGQTRVYKLLQPYRDKPGADLDAVALTLVKIAQMSAELPQVVELDINPLLADDDGVIALDARIVVKKMDAAREGMNSRFAVRPWPSKWAYPETLTDGKEIMIRPIRPVDERLYNRFIEKTTADDIRLRLFLPLRRLSHELIARLTQIDYARAMAFIAIDPDSGEMLGVSRLASDSDYRRAEYGIITRSDMKGRGIGWALMQRLLTYAEDEGIGELWGQVLATNTGMLKMCRELGFSVKNDPEESGMFIVSMKPGEQRKSE